MAILLCHHYFCVRIACCLLLVACFLCCDCALGSPSPLLFFISLSLHSPDSEEEGDEVDRLTKRLNDDLLRERGKLVRDFADRVKRKWDTRQTETEAEREAKQGEADEKEVKEAEEEEAQGKVVEKSVGVVRLMRGHKLPLTCSALSEDDRWAVSGSKDGSLIR